jgi:hypothetical protein
MELFSLGKPTGIFNEISGLSYVICLESLFLHDTSKNREDKRLIVFFILNEFIFNTILKSGV